MLPLLKNLFERIEENKEKGIELTNESFLEILAELIKQEEKRLDF